MESDKISRQSSHSSVKLFSNCSILNTPPSKVKQFLSKETPKNSFKVFPNANTPPRPFKVRNPFEPNLTERLHLPLICSPSIFKMPTSPQDKSSQFEWTIDDVSSLGPANVEAHETQFENSPDPELEARAQAAISSFFKERIVLPSPNESPMCRSKIVSICDNSKSFILRPGSKPILLCNQSVQTVLTLPPILPEEDLKVLSKYFIFNCEADENVMSVANTPNQSPREIEETNISLRRKLFKMSKKFHGTPPPRSPDLVSEPMTAKNSENMIENNSFGSLSPISKTPDNKLQLHWETSNKEIEDVSMRQSTIPTNMSVDILCESKDETMLTQSIKLDGDDGLSNSQSSESSNSSISLISSSTSHSPTSKTPQRRRIGIRKNLSQSFLLNVCDDDDDVNDINSDKNQSIQNDNIKVQNGFPNLIHMKENSNQSLKLTFHRADSGFNDITTTTQDESKFTLGLNEKFELEQRCLGHDLEEDGLIINNPQIMCCSTPSKKFKQCF